MNTVYRHIKARDRKLINADCVRISLLNIYLRSERLKLFALEFLLRPDLSILYSLIAFALNLRPPSEHLFVAMATKLILGNLGSFCGRWSTDDVKQKKQKTENRTTLNKTQVYNG